MTTEIPGWGNKQTVLHLLTPGVRMVMGEGWQLWFDVHENLWLGPEGPRSASEAFPHYLRPSFMIFTREELLDYRHISEFTHRLRAIADLGVCLKPRVAAMP